MTSIMKRTEEDSAVSPVVGVMLMLVVTIIIAAVVAVFASGVATTEEKVPNVMLNVVIDSGWTTGMPDYEKGQGTVVVSSLSGELIDMSKVTVKVADTADRGSFTYHPSEYLKPGESMNLVYADPSLYDSETYKTSLLSESLGFVPASGDIFAVTMVYNGNIIIYEKEVMAS